MKLKIKILLLCVLFYNNTFAQKKFAPVGAEWCYQYVTVEDELTAYLGLTVVKDTLIPPWEAKLIRGKLINISSPEDLSRYNQDYLYIEQNDSIFFIYGANSPLFYLFNTRYFDGDTILTYLFNSEFLVTQIDSTTYPTEQIHVADIELELNPEIQLKMYGHLGPSTGFIEGWWTNPLQENTFELAAYRDDDIGTITLRSEGCFGILDFEPPATKPPDACELVAFPNPVNTLLNLRLNCNEVRENNFDMYIRDASGKLCQQVSITFEENYEHSVAQLPAGQYFGILKNKTNTYDFKFTIIR
ncbi:MAG: T9SS type A sorting domain-containing protein [Bacteroidota bacterium]